MISAAVLEKIDVEGVYGKLWNACDMDIGLTVVEWLCRNSWINGELFSFRGYEYLIQPLNDMHPRQAITKPSQVGASEGWARKMFALLYRYGTVPYYYEENGEERSKLGIDGIYSFPNYDDVRKFGKDRLITDIIKASPLFKVAMKESESEAVDQIGLYDSFCYLVGRKSDAGNQSIPAEIVCIDEYDRPLNGNPRILSALAARTRNAKIYGNEWYQGLVMQYGTPTLPDETGRLIDGQYYLSDQHEWEIRCTNAGCGHWQVVEYPASIANYYEKGEKPHKKAPYWMCLKCGRPLDFTKIGNWNRENPLVYENARWVARHPERTKRGDGIRGYRIPFATLQNTARKILSQRDGDHKNSKADFYNYTLGLAYMDNTIGLTEEDFTRMRTDEVQWGEYDSSCPHIMGVDQGCYLVVARLKPESRTDLNPFGIWQTVWAEYVKESEAFSKVERDDSGVLKVKEGEIAKRVNFWHPEVLVCDHLPNTAAAEADAALAKQIWWLCDSKGNPGMDRVDYQEEVKDKEGNVTLRHRVTEHRHQAIDEYFQQIRSHRWEYPMKADDTFSRFTAHHKNVKKVTKEEGGYTYESFGADHFCQAGKLCSEAAELFGILKPQVKRAGILLISGFSSKRVN